MNRKLKALGLALVAALAMSAATASAASAESFDFHSEVDHTALTGASAGTHKFTVDAGTATCETIDFSGTLSEEETEKVALTPVYTKCNVDPSGTADFNMKSCQYVLEPVTKESSTYKAQLSIACKEEGDSIEVKVTVLGATVCTIHIPPQVLEGATVSEVSEGDVKAVIDSEGIEYDQTAGAGCSKAENTTNGTYEGEVTIGGSLEELDATIGMQKKAAVIQMPAGVEFNGVNTKAKIKIENVHTAKIGIKQLNFVGEFFKHLSNNCDEIDVGKSCEVEMECIKLAPKGKSVYLVAESKTPRDLDATELEKCSQA